MSSIASFTDRIFSHQQDKAAMMSSWTEVQEGTVAATGDDSEARPLAFLTFKVFVPRLSIIPMSIQ